MAEDDTPLTALCALCHVNSIKYTCPRCFIHTCSLKCVKLHKQRAQCNGIRDPGAYVRRIDLATEVGIDRDFNFISSVERGVGRAEERYEEMVPVGIGWSRKQANWEDAVRESGVKVIRAPEGLSRRKLNKSDVKGSGLMWTVEWLWDGEKRVMNVTETKRIGQTFVGCFGKRAGRKRKRHDEGRIGEEKDDHDPSEQQAKNENSPGSQKEETTQSPLEGLLFYLHRPQTSSKLKCLVPVEPTSTWKEVLKGRTVLEFPTIHVREEAPDHLPAPFILERDYLEQHGEDVVVKTVLQPTLPNEPDPTQPTLDSNKVLEVLKQDLEV